MRILLWVSAVLFTSIGVVSMVAPRVAWNAMQSFNRSAERRFPALSGQQDPVLIKGNERMLARFAGIFPLAIGLVSIYGLLNT